MEQLLINKTISDEVVGFQRDLVCVWLDYKKAFDSVPHDWLLESLRLAKVPELLVKAIANLTKLWATRLFLSCTKSSLQTDAITFKKGILQGDSLSVLLFILAVNPLSHLLKNRKGYALGKPNERHNNISHLFFVDDLKLFAPNLDAMKHLLEIVTTFSKDICMEFGHAKCAYMVVKHGKVLTTNEELEMNGLILAPIGPNDVYKYLGLDEAISYDGPLNKERVTKEYLRRVRKIWSSELSSVNKSIAHNSFAVPVLIPTFGLLQWNIKELEDIDIRTRKLLCATGNFHINGDIDRLYLPRTKGGRGLKSAFSTFQVRIITLYKHLVRASGKNPYLTNVIENEAEGIVRIAEQLMKTLGLAHDPSASSRTSSKAVSCAINNIRMSSLRAKVMHGYFIRELERKPDVDVEASLSWSRSTRMTSHFEGFVHAVQEQEISTKFLMHKRQLASGIRPSFDNSCRLCKLKVEDVSHIMVGCEKMSARYYIPLLSLIHI